MDSEVRSYQFAIKAIEFIDTLPTGVSTQVIARQLLRAATSVGANIAEAQSGTSRKDFTNFFSHSLKSANETKYWLKLLRDTKKADNKTVDVLIKEIDEISNILGSSILTLKGKRKL